MFDGKGIKKYRKEKGMTQEELGAATGVGTSYIRKYASNLTCPRIDSTYKTADALGVKPENLISEELPEESTKTTKSNMPENITFDFGSYCSACDLCDLSVQEYGVTADDKHITLYRLTCKHDEACQRMRELGKEEK